VDYALRDGGIGDAKPTDEAHIRKEKSPSIRWTRIFCIIGFDASLACLLSGLVYLGQALRILDMNLGSGVFGLTGTVLLGLLVSRLIGLGKHLGNENTHGSTAGSRSSPRWTADMTTIPTLVETKYHEHAVFNWNGPRISILSATEQAIAHIPLAFVAQGGNNTWNYVLEVTKLLVVENDGWIFANHQPVNAEAMPIAGTFVYRTSGPSEKP
jgi:hypothetical protein